MKMKQIPQDDLFQVKSRSPKALRKAFEKLPEDLHECADQIYGLFSDLTATDAAGRFKIGQVVLRVSKETKYGDKGVKDIAKAFGWSVDRLYQCKRVVETWPEGIDGFFVTTEEPRRQPVTWSHFVELTRAEDRRDELLKEVQERGLTVKQLREEIAKLPAKAKKGKPANPTEEASRNAEAETGDPAGKGGEAGVATVKAAQADGMPAWLASIVGRIKERVDEDEVYVRRFLDTLKRAGADATLFDRAAATERVAELMERRAKADEAVQMMLTQVLDVLRSPKTKAA